MHWHKPSLGLVECGPDPTHLTDLGLHCPLVFIDPHIPSNQRYRAAGYGKKAADSRLSPD